MSRPALHLVDPETGEVHESCPSCAILEDQVAGLERDIRGWATRYAQLRRDREYDARNDELWASAESLFGYWRLRCRHPRSQFTADRFEAVRPYLSKYGDELCRRAIDGAAFDPYVTTRKNGSTQRHDDWELIFRDAGKFESFCNRAPRDAA